MAIYTEYQNLTTALSNISTSNKALFVATTCNITDNTVIPSNVDLTVAHGGVFNISSGKTLTINGSLNAGVYQIFSGSGTVVFSATARVSEVHPAWWGAIADGSTDCTTAIAAAITTAEAVRGKVILPHGTCAISSKLTIDDQVSMIGYGQGSYENFGLFTPQTSLKWTGVLGGTMLQVGTTSSGVCGVVLDGFCLDANDLAGVCLEIYALKSSEVRNLLCWRYAENGIGIRMTSLAGNGDNVHFNNFQNIQCISYNTTTQGIVMVDAALSNMCMNTFINTRIGFTGNLPGMVVKGDNNTFFQTFLFRAAGTGYGVEVGSTANLSCLHNYWYHIQPSAGGMSFKDGTRGNWVFGYDRANGEAAATIEAGSWATIMGTNYYNYLSSIFGLTQLSQNFTIYGPLSGSVAVTQNATTKDIVLPEQPDHGFSLLTAINWSSTHYVSGKVTVPGSTTVTVTFGTQAPADAYLTWFMVA